MKTYDRVKGILLRDRGARNSDKRLMFLVWREQDVDCNNYDQWMSKKAAHPKSIIESRRILQRKQEEKLENGEDIPESEILIADKVYKKYRDLIDAQRGTHIFREEDGQGVLV